MWSTGVSTSRDNGATYPYQHPYLPTNSYPISNLDEITCACTGISCAPILQIESVPRGTLADVPPIDCRFGRQGLGKLPDVAGKQVERIYLLPCSACRFYVFRVALGHDWR